MSGHLIAIPKKKHRYFSLEFSSKLMSPSYPHVIWTKLDYNFSITLLLFHQSNISFCQILNKQNTPSAGGWSQAKSGKCELGISCFLLIIIWPMPVSCLSPAFHPAPHQVYSKDIWPPPLSLRDIVFNNQNDLHHIRL